MSEISNIEFEYYECDRCGMKSGFLPDEEQPQCSACSLERAEKIAKGEEKICLQETALTKNPKVLSEIRSKCADGGCNICLSDTSFDDIEWPKHYNTGKIQPIDVIEDWQLDFRLANAVKYIARAGKKDPNKTKQDLEKALWYIRRYIEKEL